MDDKLLILEDTNGDGKADKRTVFAGDLQQPDRLRVLQRRRASSRRRRTSCSSRTPTATTSYDVKEILLHGFDTADTHHTINSFTFDPGGALYMQEGIFHRTQVESPWGPATRLADGGVFRFEPRTWKFEVYVPMNFPNPHGHVFDHWGRDIVFDAHRRPAVLRAVVLDEEVLPGHGDATSAPQAGQRARRARSAAPRSCRAATFPRRCRATCSCST